MPHKDPAARRRYLAAHRERERVRDRARYARDREKRLAKQKEIGARQRAEGRAWYQRHPELVRLYGQKYRAEHDGELAAYRAQHREDIRRGWEEWRARQPQERIRLLEQVKNANKNAKRRGVPGTLTFADVEYLPLECVYCGATEDLTLDHATPMSRGGRNDWSNLTVACFRCNRSKGDMRVAEFREVRRVA